MIRQVKEGERLEAAMAFSNNVRLFVGALPRRYYQAVSSQRTTIPASVCNATIRRRDSTRSLVMFLSLSQH